MTNRENVGADSISAQNKYKYDTNPVGACIARPQEEKNNPNAVGAGPVSAQNKTTESNANAVEAESISAQMKSHHAITLIALIIIIIIMLILAGVVLSLSIDEHGIFKTSKEAVIKQDIASIKEQIQLDIIDKQAENNGNITDTQLKAILEKYGNINYENDNTTIKGITTKEKGYNILLSELFQGSTTSVSEFKIEKSKLDNNMCQITLKDVNKNNVKEVSYKPYNSNTWISNGKNLTFTLEKPGIFDIKLEDKLGNTITNQVYNYVTNGLLVHFDGIDNTREGQNASATTWEDLTENKNDAIGYNIGTSIGYYSKEEKGYALLENSARFCTKDKLQITGDDNFTIESVMKILDPTPKDWSTPVWIGRSSGYHLGGVVYPFYDTKLYKFGVGYINANNIYSDDTYENVIGNTSTLSWRKIRTGKVSKGDKDYLKINFNGEIVNSTYTGNSSFTQNLTAGPALIGRSYQQNNEDRTCNAVIKNIRIYNRALTDEEIQANYEIDKYRFNIET